MLDAIATGLKLLTIKEAQFLIYTPTRTIVFVTLFNILAIYAIISSWKHGRSPEILLVVCIFVTMIMLEITGVKTLTTNIASVGG